RALLLEQLVHAEQMLPFYQHLLSVWREPGIVLGASESAAEQIWHLDPPDCALEHMELVGSYVDLQRYLIDDILVKVDRASMAVSLEARAPLLDYRVVQMAARVPYELKMREGQGKWVLRRLLERYVPRELFERPKMGFGIPLGSWLRGPLRAWAEALLEPRRLRDEGYFEVGTVRRRWLAHQRGSADHAQELWGILMFQAWLEAGAEHQTVSESQ
ncbi:MAG: asparagine synthase C-terminal domain-containing protein, partial [Myxococcales bacterium]|nr:asparagine synthase C-terminal domain-containing protein [Myxococcales bacterium]